MGFVTEHCCPDSRNGISTCHSTGMDQHFLFPVRWMQRSILSWVVVVSVSVIGFAPVITDAQQQCRHDIEATAPADEFVVHGDGTVTHIPTRLMWKQCLQGMIGLDCRGIPNKYSWGEALAAAEDETYAGFTNWRLPNIKELHSIVEYRCISPAIDTAVFPNTLSSWLWSATPFSHRPNFGRAVNFTNGEATADHMNAPYLYEDGRFIRLVRDGSVHD